VLRSKLGGIQRGVQNCGRNQAVKTHRLVSSCAFDVAVCKLMIRDVVVVVEVSQVPVVPRLHAASVSRGEGRSVLQDGE